MRRCPIGLGAPVFEKLEAALASAVMSLPATKVWARLPHDVPCKDADTNGKALCCIDNLCEPVKGIICSGLCRPCTAPVSMQDLS